MMRHLGASPRCCSLAATAFAHPPRRPRRREAARLHRRDGAVRHHLRPQLRRPRPQQHRRGHGLRRLRLRLRRRRAARHLLPAGPLGEGGQRQPRPRPDRPAGNALYRNKGGFQFEDVTEKAGVAGRSFAFGCSAADYDNDGDQDLIVLTYGAPSSTATTATAPSPRSPRRRASPTRAGASTPPGSTTTATATSTSSSPTTSSTTRASSARSTRRPATGPAQLQRRLQRPLPQQQRRHVHRRDEGGRRRATPAGAP